MSKLPKNFPEYSLLYKNLNKKVTDLKNHQITINDESIKKEIQLKIESYQKEMNKIKSIFPEDFFENNL
ncbi:MAG: hypothetical protein ACO293_07905 [Nitrosopumilaceae archaeon]